MILGNSWLRHAERAAGDRARRLLDQVEGELEKLLPGLRVERNEREVRIAGTRLIKRWVADPALRFLLWSLK